MIRPLFESKTFAPQFPDISDSHRRALYQRYYDLPVRIGTSSGFFWVSRHNGNWQCGSLAEAYRLVCRLIEQENARRTL